MKTTIRINNLDVEFTDEVPTKAGAYWYTVAELAPQLIHIQSGNTGVLYVSGEGSLDGFYGLWSAPLVPVTEVEKALPNYPYLTGSNASSIAYHLEQGRDNGGITREALALYLRSVASIFEKLSDAKRVVDGTP